MRAVLEWICWVILLLGTCLTCYNIGRTEASVDFANQIMDILYEEIRMEEITEIKIN